MPGVCLSVPDMCMVSVCKADNIGGSGEPGSQEVVCCRNCPDFVLTNDYNNAAAGNFGRNKPNFVFDKHRLIKLLFPVENLVTILLD